MTEQSGNSIEKFPSFEEKIIEIKSRLVNNFKLGLLLIDCSKLREVEYSFGKTVHSKVLELLEDTIRELLDEKQIRKDDIITVNMKEGDIFYIFLSKQRQKGSFRVEDYEKLGERIRRYIDRKLFPLVFSITKKKISVNIGYAVSFYNPSVKASRIIQSMISDAEQMARFQDIRNRMLHKEAVYELIVDKLVNIVYQPIIDLNTQKIIGYEALARGPENSDFEQPDVLFGIAKDIGLLHELDWLCKVCTFIDAKDLDAGYKLFINILSTSIHDSKTRIKYLEDILSGSSIHSHDIIFEISDRNVLENMDFFNDITQLYSNMSFAIKIDNSWLNADLASLNRLNVRYFKLGRSLVRELQGSGKGFIQTLKDLAHMINAEIIAEGIENKEELKTLLDLGITLGQGYLFARPDRPFPEVTVTEMYVEDEGLKRKLLASIYHKRGMDYFSRGLYDQSILEFTKTLELSPDDIDALYYKGHAFFEDGCYGAALQELNKVVKSNPDYAKAYFSIGLVYEKTGNFQKSVESFEKYLELAPAVQQTNIALAKQKLQKLKDL